MKQRVLALSAVTALATSGLGLAYASADGGNPQQPLNSAASARSTAPIVCDGGVQKQVKNRIKNTPFTFSESAGFVSVPGAALSIAGPNSGSDTLVVTFSSEARLSNSTGIQDWIGLQVELDGVPIQPYTASGDVMALTGSPTWGMHSATFCTKVGPGNHTVRVKTNLADFDTDDQLSGWLDDYTLSVERSE